MANVGLFFYSLYFAIVYWLFPRPFQLIADVFTRVFKKAGALRVNAAIVRVLFFYLAVRLTVEYGAPYFQALGGTIPMIAWIILGLFLGSYVHSVVLIKFFELQEFFESLLLGNVWGTIILIILEHAART